ncbi:ribonuclease III [Candidatus Peregrinibacteria bacterium]|nr:ribonuclease III [Candidatus Peregrinibacteria bacterium]
MKNSTTPPVNRTSIDRFSPLEKKLGVIFKNRNILTMAFIHKSYMNEVKNKSLENNERLEFLGDAVLELVVTEYLYLNYDSPEGVLTNWRSALVKGKNLAEIASKLNLGAYLSLSKGERESGGEHKSYILANTFEALIGALYLDQGLDVARHFINHFVIKYLDEIIEKGLYIDSKSRFQEISQETFGITPEYRLLSEEGPDHDKHFTMGAFLGEKMMGEGKGTSKQNAEQVAAENVLKQHGWK